MAFFSILRAGLILVMMTKLPQSSNFAKIIQRLSSPTEGFTLIELLVVTTLSIMLMLGATAIFLTFLVSNTKTSGSQLIKNEGKYAQNQIEFLIRNAVTVIINDFNQVCDTNMSQIRLKAADNGLTLLFSENSKIASNSGTYLTSSSVDLIEGPIFNCSKSDDGVSYHVGYTFTLRKGTPGLDEATEIQTETFSGAAQIRSL